MKKINIEKKRQIVERSIRLYKDWLSTKNNKTIYEMKSILKVGSKSGGSTKLVECTKQMGQDGQSLIRIFQENWDLFGDTPPKAKINFMKLLEAETPKVKVNKEDSGSVVHSIETQYFPVSDRSNQMNSVETPNDRDLVVQIRNAATGGNMEIAKQLITSGWGSLSLKQRNGLIEWVNSIGAFNTKFDGQDYTAPDPSKKTLKMIPMKSRSDMTKNEFANGFVRTAIENSKLS
jgi:hypothetical protein